MSAAGKGELSKTQSRSRLRLGDIKTLNSPDGNWLRRRNSIPRRIPPSRSFSPISLLPLGMLRHMKNDGSNQVNLTNNSSFIIDAAWSPDGKRILLDSDRTGLAQIYTM